ncbi:exported hypothetical protein [Frankia sp. Hr75.2]|nr:exported hypothetical protein [Frankia sp. Hr75.2]
MCRLRGLAVTGLLGFAVAFAGCSAKEGTSGAASSTRSETAGTRTAGTAASSAAVTDIDGSDDVAITACTVDSATGWMSVEVTVTNHGSQKGDYVITIAFDAADGRQIDIGMVTVQALAPGQKSEQRAFSYEDPVPGFTCRVEDVFQLPA